MGYSYNRFLKPLQESDKTIKIYDDRNYAVYTVNPFSVLQIYVTNNNLCVALTNSKLIVLDFINTDESKESLVKLQSYVDQLKQNTTIVDNSKEEEINQAILSTAGYDGLRVFNGSTASVQNISIINDDNIEIDLVLDTTTMAGTNSDVSSAIHNLTVNWTGILPVTRGGLNNTLFNPDQILISNVDSIISSGFIFNDYGISNTDIWSADKVIREITTSNINKETPSGVIDGVNKVFRLLYEPVLNSEHIYLNGLLQDGDGDSDCDYTMSGNKITFNEAPIPGDKLKCSYMVKKKTMI